MLIFIHCVCYRQFSARFGYVISFVFELGAMLTKQKPLPGPTLWVLTLHTPSFMPPDPQLWFTLVKLNFENYMETGDIRRFRWVASRLSPDETLQFRDVTGSTRI